jgi:hypothetical protein
MAFNFLLEICLYICIVLSYLTVDTAHHTHGYALKVVCHEMDIFFVGLRS